MNNIYLFILISFYFSLSTLSAQKINKESLLKTNDEIKEYELNIPNYRLGFQMQASGSNYKGEGNGTLGLYFKYKPFHRFDFDAGTKWYFSVLEDNSDSYNLNNIEYQYSNYQGGQIYLAVNSSLAFDKQNANDAFYTSLEFGLATNKCELSQFNSVGNRISTNSFTESSMYFEWKLGYNYYGGFLGENTGAKVYVGINNVPYYKSSYQDKVNRGFESSSYSPGSLFLGISFEFGLKKTHEQKSKKIKEKRNKAIIDKYEGKKS